MAEKEECICEPLEVEGPQPLQNDILMKDIKLCINVLNRAKDCKYRTQYLHIIREERYHLLNVINKIKAEENKENAGSSKEDLERNRFMKEMEIELERNRIMHMRREWARQQNSLAKVQENLFKKCRLLSLHSNYASLQGHSLCSPLAMLLEKKEVVEFFLDEQDTYLISFVEIASGCLTSYVRTYAYEAPLEDSPDTGFILALYTCIAHIAALPNGRKFLMGKKECQEMVCSFISDLPRLKYCSTRKIKLALVKVLHNLGRSQNGSGYLWNCVELPDTLNQLIEQEFEPNTYKLILEVYTEITRKVPDEECFKRLTNSINRERLSELTLSKYKGVNHLPKVILANVERADKFFTNERERQKLQDAISKHSMKQFNMEDLWSDDSLPGANCRKRAESYEKCTCNKPRAAQRSKSETCIWAKPPPKTASSKSISVKLSCKLRGSRTSRSVGTAVSSTQKIHRQSKDGKSGASLKITVSKNVGKSSSRVNSISTSRKSSTAGCTKCASKKSGSSQKSSKGCQCASKTRSSTAQRPSKGKVTMRVSSNKNVSAGCKSASKSRSGTSQRSSKGRMSVTVSRSKSATGKGGSKCAPKSESGTSQRSSKVHNEEGCQCATQSPSGTSRRSSRSKGVNDDEGCQCALEGQFDTAQRSSKVRMSVPSNQNLYDDEGCQCGLESPPGTPQRSSKGRISVRVSKRPSGSSQRSSKGRMSIKVSSSKSVNDDGGCKCAPKCESGTSQRSSKVRMSVPSNQNLHDEGCQCATESPSGTSQRSSKVRMSVKVSSSKSVNDDGGCKCASKSASSSCPNLHNRKSSQIREGSRKSISMKSLPSHANGCPCASKNTLKEKSSGASGTSYKSCKCNSVVSVYRNSRCNFPNENTSMVPWTSENRQLARLSDLKQKDRAKIGPFKVINKLVIHAPSKPHKVVTRIKIKGISLADQPCSSKRS